MHLLFYNATPQNKAREKSIQILTNIRATIFSSKCFQSFEMAI